MLTNVPTSGAAFKMTVFFVSAANPELKEYVMYGSDNLELMEHYNKIKHLFKWVQKIELLDYIKN